MRLYTRTVCPKCMWIKSEMQRFNVEAEIINIDHNVEARNQLAEAGVMSVPVLEVGGAFILDTNEMVERLEQISA